MFKNGVGVLVISKIIKLIGLGVNKSYIRMDQVWRYSWVH